MKLLVLAGDIEDIIAEVRLRTPLRALAARQAWTLALKSFHDCTRVDLASADVLVVQRAMSRRVLRMQQFARQRGCAVIYEIDDLLTEISPHISQYRAVRARLPWLRECMAQADAVSVSTRLLGESLLVEHPMVVPNYAISLGAAPLPPHQPGEPVTILLASSEYMATDFIVPALMAVSRLGAEVVVIGPPGSWLAQAGVKVRRQAFMPRPQFVDFARSLPNPLAVIPLEDTRFAACKSAVKWFDYAEAGIPTLCSAVSPYREVMDDGRTGALVPNDVSAWEDALRRAAGDAAWRRRVAEAARAEVRQHFTLDATVQAWQRAIAEALRRRATRMLSPLSLAERLQQGLGDVLESGLLPLRRLNRARLARRKQAAR